MGENIVRELPRQRQEPQDVQGVVLRVRAEQPFRKQELEASPQLKTRHSNITRAAVS